MTEESKPPKVNLSLHRMNMVGGFAGAALCLGFVIVAKLINLGLSDTLQEILIFSGLASAGVSIYGAKQLPGAK